MALFTSIKCIGGWIERPFNDSGDEGHKLFRFQCVVDAGVYTALPLSTLITDASAAAVAGLDGYPADVWPVSADGNCYFVGDTTPAPYGSGPLVSFVRTFSSIPSTRTRAAGAVSHTWPAFRAWNASTQTSFSDVFDAQNDNMPPEFVLRDELTKSSPGSITYTYSYATAITGVTADEIWEPKWQDTSSTDDFRDTPTGNFVCDQPSGSSTSMRSDPSLTTYKGYIDSSYLIVSSRIKNYLGNIFVKETIKALAQ
mgnify:CR=1 FL=1